MDAYTVKTKDWLERRFRETDEKGVYQSHAPIYGFSNKHIFLGIYKNNFAILKEIERLASRYSIGDCLEVGCAEGYTAHLAQAIFGLKVYVLDLSLEAIKRAREIYNLRGFVADAQSLDCIKDNSFDLVICSETLEHLPEARKALEGLLKIARKALIITVPAAKTEREKEQFKASDEPHSHLHIFTKDDLKEVANNSRIREVSFNWLDKIERLFTTDDKPAFHRNSKCLILFYQILRLLFAPIRKFYGSGMAKIFIKLDYWTGGIFSLRAVTYIAVYPKVQPESNKKIRRLKILDFMLKKDKVGPYFIDKR